MGDHSLLSSHRLLPALSTDKKTPLGQLIGQRYSQKEYKRIRRIGNVFSAFHLKKSLVEKVSGREAVINGKKVINFGSANYLGLDQNQEVIEASKKALDEWGCHAGSSRIFYSQEPTLQLEAELSKLVGAERTILGHNLSQTHAGVIPALFGCKESQIFVDRFAHTSMFQAARISQAQGAHLMRVDVSKLEQTKKLLAESMHPNKVLLIDGVYSMQGHTPPLRELAKICQDTGTILYVDDAHGIGVFGKRGGGVFEDGDYNNLLVTGSLQKAFGTYGGFISGNKDVIEYLRLTSKAYIFSGTLQPSAIAGAREAVKICQNSQGQSLRKRLFQLSDIVRQEIAQLGFDVIQANSPIVPVVMGDDVKTLMAGRKLFDEGIYLNSVLYPAVPRNEGLLRISLNAIHSQKQIGHLIDAFGELKTYLKKYNSKWQALGHVAKEVVSANIQASRYRGL